MPIIYLLQGIENKREGHSSCYTLPHHFEIGWKKAFNSVFLTFERINSQRATCLDVRYQVHRK
uniref:Uncharacterized protein n=1 Tax=Rhizophora mucronata TaxID=61149 RepID=A0A2P2J2U5_RHIMU